MITFEKKSKYGDFNDTLGMSIDTGDKWLNKKLNVNLCYGKGGGGGGSQPQDVPKTLQPYVKDVLGKAKGLYGSYQRFQGYPGERIVGFSPQEQAAMGGIEGLVGRGISATPGLTDASTYYAPALGLLGRSGALGARAVEDIGAEEIMGRMSPYQQAVTDIAKRKAVEEGKQYMTELGGQAARTGGFGGSRQAILEGMAAGDLGQRLTDIQTTGSQAAYQDALRAAEAQRARLSGGATQAGALSQAFGGLGQQALGQGYREQGYLSGVGEQQRGMEQQRADLAYQQFVEEREFPSTQLQKYSSLIQGFPFQFSQAPQQPSSFQTAAGGIATLGGLGRGLGFFNKGGDIGKGGLAGIVNKRKGGSISDLIKQIEQEEDEEKKSELINEVLIRTGSTNNKEPRLAKTIKERFLPYSESDSPLSGLAKAAGRGVIETISLPSTLGYIGAGAAEGLTTPKNILALQDQKRKLTPLSDEAFDTASALEAAIGKGTITPAQAQTVNLRDITSDDLQAAQNIASTPAVTPTDATTTPAASAAETMEEKLKRLMAGSAFDREAREKQLKSEQGFALANMGLGILSADPSRGALAAIGQGAQQGMPQLMQARKELEGLDKEEREAELSAFTKELGLSKIIKDLDSSRAAALPSAARRQELVASVFRGRPEAARMPKYAEAIEEANQTALIKAERVFTRGNIDPDSNEAANIMDEILQEEYRKIPKGGTTSKPEGNKQDDLLKTGKNG